MLAQAFASGDNLPLWRYAAESHVFTFGRKGCRAASNMSQQNLSSFIWSVADLLRGDCKQSEYGKVILPVSATVTGRIEAREFAYQETT